MTPRERFISALTFGTPDKFPLWPGWPRESTRARWVSEGMPQAAADKDAVGYVIKDILGLPYDEIPNTTGFFVNMRMDPAFEEKVLEHRGNTYIVQDWMGAVVQISDKYDITYLQHAKDFVTRKWFSFPVKNREDWEKLKFRYDPMDEMRLPKNIEEVGKRTFEYDGVISFGLNGPFWQLREWMGMENLCMAFIDMPDLVHEMIDFWCDFVLKLLDRFLPYCRITWVHFNEDMAYKQHAMISPKMAREFLLPTYKKWVDKLKKYNIPVLDMDSDGFVEELVPVWLDAGMNVIEPMEVAAGNDIVHFRQRFGKNLGYMGGIDKRAIAAGGDVMRKEVMRVVPPLLKDGGFIPICDHGVPSDISLKAFTDYTDLLAKLIGWK